MGSVIFKRSLAALKASGAQYIVVMPDGTTYLEGNLQLASQDKKGKRSKGKYSYGTLSEHYKPLIQKLQKGEMTEVPFGSFPPEILRSSLTGAINNSWGKNSAVTAVNHTKKVIEVLRYA